MLRVTLLLSFSTAAYADTMSCFPDSFDADGDGYAVSTADSGDKVTVTVTEEESLTCPAGYVFNAGDCDDTDSGVRPRQYEVRENGTDDNCDGRVDETEFWYSPWGTGQAVDGFEVPVHIADDNIMNVYGSSATLQYKLEYQELEDTGTTYTTAFKDVTWLWDYGTYGYTHLEIDGLDAATMYRVRVRFYRKTVGTGPGGLPLTTRLPVGVQSGWYYSMTDSTNTLESARMSMVMYGLSEYGNNQLEEVGYLGSWYADGTRYGADMGEAWCSEFYSWVADHELIDINHRHSVSTILDYFEDEGNRVDIDSSNRVLVEWLAQPGDYLGEDTDLDGAVNHSAMFLAWDQASDTIITLDGNTTGRVDVDEASRQGGSEVSLRRRSPSVIMHWGWLDTGML